MRQRPIAPTTTTSCSTAAAAAGKMFARSGERNQRRPRMESGAGCEGASTSAMSTTDSE